MPAVPNDESDEVEFEEEDDGGASDPTMVLAEQFADPSKWDKVIRKIPIFKSHEAIDKDGRVKYRIDPKKLKAIADAINENWERYGKPLKLFLGHTKDPKTTPQSQQPPLVGFAKDAVVGRYGPERELGVLTTWFIKPGWLEKVKDYPERSPEFYPNKSEITAVALLKTDPRLNMGMVTYERSDGAVLYQRGFDMPVMDDPKPTDDPTKLPDDDMDQVDEPNDEDVAKFMKYMAGCMKKYMAPAASGTNGGVPAPGGAPAPTPEPDGDPIKMGRGEMAAQYEALRIANQKMETRLKSIEREREKERVDYARTTAANLVNTLIIREKVKVKNPKKLIEKLAACKSDQERMAIVQDCRENYARDDEPVAGRSEEIDLRIMTAHGMLPSYDGHAEGAADEPQANEADIDAAVMYCEENHLDSTKDSDWAKAMKHVAEERKTSRQAA